MISEEDTSDNLDSNNWLFPVVMLNLKGIVEKFRELKIRMVLLQNINFVISNKGISN